MMTRPTHRSCASPLPARRQRGAVTVMAALQLFVLLGFMGVALDLGRMFIVKTELQTAMDSCALAAAQELDGQSSALTRARSAGLTAANLNKVNLQSASWDGKGQLSAAEITFKDGAFADTTAPTAKYAVCRHTQSGIKMWLLRLAGVSSGNQAAFPATRAVLASAVGSRASAQSTCPVPVAIKGRTGGSAPNYGFLVGEWVTVYDKGGASAGEMGWYNLDGSSNASETRDELSETGHCGVRVGDQLGTPGSKVAVDAEWNQRFGIYKANSPDDSHPDQTGYSYSTLNWPAGANAFGGPAPTTGSDPGKARNYVTQRANFVPYGTTLDAGSTIVFNKSNALNSFKSVANSTYLMSKSTSRRLVLVPVIDGNRKVTDYVCMLMLGPMTGPNNPVQMEFVGNAGGATSPCTTNGLAGGTAGPLVPVLVR